jgi:hypothetical protein
MMNHRPRPARAAFEYFAAEVQYLIGYADDGTPEWVDYVPDDCGARAQIRRHEEVYAFVVLCSLDGIQNEYLVGYRPTAEEAKVAALDYAQRENREGNLRGQL